jgi:uncharacterized phage protein (TIGR02218 family)
MKSVSSETLSILASRQFYSANCYAFTLVGGGTAYLTDGGRNLTLNGVTYQAGGPVLTRSQLSQKTGLEVASLTITLYPKPTDLLDGEPWLKALRQGQLDGASVTLTRAFMSAPGNTSGGGVLMFSGRVAEIDIGRTQAQITVNAWTELLSIKMPRNVYQSGCGWTLYGPGCTVNKALYAVNAVVTADPIPSSFYTDLSQFPTGWFALGQMTMTSGANTGISRTVTQSISDAYEGWAAIILLSPLPVAPALGDSFTIWPGCDKSLGTCEYKFGNLRNYRGFPFIPAAETAV